MAYPSTIDSFNDPIATDPLNLPSHSALHQSVNTAVEALETKVGVDSSAVDTTMDFKLSEITGGDKAVGKTATQTLTNKTLTSPKINENVAMTSTSTELNYLDGSTPGAAVASKALVVDANKDISLGTGDLTATDITATNAVNTVYVLSSDVIRSTTNNKAFQGVDSTATARDLLAINGSNNIVIGADDTNGHTIINAGTSSLVKIKVLRQNDTTNVYEENTVLLHGWGYIVGNGTALFAKTVTFGITFSVSPSVMSAFNGARPTADGTPTGTNWFTTSVGALIGSQSRAVTTSTFNFYAERAAGTFANTNNFGYNWFAISQLN